jgi:hypothetical protein
MTVAIDLIPDGLPEIPAEARDSSIVATHLEGGGIEGVPNTPLSGWRDVERVVDGKGRSVKLRVGDEDTTVNDLPDAALDTIATAIVSNINGLKAHPDGWHDVETP